jgi:ATP-dependent Clp endopeptidase proteolytic subunit ClpP
MSKAPKFWDVKKSTTDAKAVDIFIYGMIGESWFSDGSETVASRFVPEFKDLETKYDRINVRINSPGGSVWDGLPVFNVISQSEKDVHTYVDGIAYSMAAIILLAGKTVHAAKNSLILLHSPLSIAWGNAKDLRSVADELDKYGDSLMTSVATKTGLTVDEVKARYFDYDDHLLSAKEALKDNLIDDIVDEEGQIPDGIENMSFRQVMNFYQDHKPNDNKFFNTIVNHLKSVFNITPKETNVTDIIMENIEKFRLALNLGAETTVDDVLTAIEDMKSQKAASDQKAADLKAENDNLSAAVTEEKAAHDATKQAFEDLKNEDAGEATGATKEKDEISSGDPDPKDEYAHNRAADKVVAKK